MKFKKGTTFIIIGLLLLVVALSFAIYNICDSARAGKVAVQTVNEIEKIIPDKPKEEFSSTVYPDKEMPTTQIDGNNYIGILEIPELNVKLPVMSDWDYNKLNISPCCYYGTAYRNDLVIAAHNYYSHFGGLGQLSVDSKIIFTDIDGTVFNYRVIWSEILQPDQIDQMIQEKENDQWDLTLFTCTISGSTRYTVRCEKITDDKF